MITAKSSGKILISGEHSVVYGEPAIVASLDIGVTVTISSGKTHLENNIVAKAFEVCGIKPQEVSLAIDSKLPIGSGMGSSAAVAAGVIKALLAFKHEHVTQNELFNLVMECERVAHGNPSGVDPAVVVFGGMIWYVKGTPIERFEIKKPVSLLLIDSGGRSESTKEMVEMVQKREADNKKIITAIGKVTRKIRTALEVGGDLMGLVNENGRMLEELGVVSEKTRGLSEQLRNMGAGVKISGAGGRKTGSGIMLVVSPDLDTIAEFARTNNLAYWRTTIGSN